MDLQQSTVKNSTRCHLLSNLILTFLIWAGFFIIYGIRCAMDIVATDAKYAEITITDSIRNKANSFVFWGYFIFQIPGGLLAMKYSGRKLFAAAILTSCLLFSLIPVSLVHVPALVKFIRFSQGLAEGAILPSCYSIWAYSIPSSLRTTLVAVAFSGCYLGILLGRLLTALLISSVSWQSPFYIYGGSGLIWFIFWMVFVSERCQKRLNVNIQQRYVNVHNISRQETSTLSKIPWGAFLSSLPIWAFFVANFCKFWFYCVTIFVGDVYSITTPEINKSPMFKIMQTVMVITVIIGGILADALRRCATTTLVRKLFCCGPFLIEAFASVVAAYSRNKYTLVISTFVSIIANGISISGLNVNLLDIAPKYACVLIGLSNTIGILASCIYYLVDYRILHGTTVWKYQWELLYLLAAVWHALAAIVYIFMASGEPLSWASITPVEEQRPTHIEEEARMVEPFTNIVNDVKDS